MNTLEQFSFIQDVHSTVLQIARQDKPTGDYPDWCYEVTDHFNDLARRLRNQLIDEYGSILKVEQAVRRMMEVKNKNNS